MPQHRPPKPPINGRGLEQAGNVLKLRTHTGALVGGGGGGTKTNLCRRHARPDGISAWMGYKSC